MNSLTISLLLPISGIVVSAVLVAVNRNKKKRQQQQGDAPVDLSWLDEYEQPKGGQKQKKQNQKAKNKNKAKKTFDKPVAVNAGEASVAASSSSESEADDHDDIALLAAIQKGSKLVKPAAPIKPVVKAVPIVESTGKIEETETGEGWASVPTKEELVLSSLRSRIDSLSKSLETSEHAKSIAEKSLAQAQEKVEKLESELKDRQHNYQLRLISVENEMAGARSQAQAMARRIAEITETELAESKEEVSRLSAELYAVEKQVKEVASEKETLLERLGQVEFVASSRAEEISQLKESLESMNIWKSKHINLESEFSNLKQILFTTESDLINLRSQEASRAAETKNLISQKEDEISCLNESISSMKTDLEASRDAEMMLTEQINVLIAEHQNAIAAAKEESEAAVNVAESKTEELKTQLEQLIAEKTAELGKAGIASSKLAEELSLAKTEAEETSKAIADLTAQFESIKADSAKTVSDLEARLSDALHQASSIQAEKEREKESIQSELALVKSRFAEHLNKSLGIKTRKQELEKENALLNLELAEIKAAIFGGVKFPKSKIQAAASNNSSSNTVNIMSDSLESPTASPSPIHR